LNRYRELIEEGTQDGAEGRELRERLVSHFGPEHPLILDCDRLIRFSAFKRRTAEEA
jgi:predicted ATP-binding protein involved in virulence